MLCCEIAGDDERDLADLAVFVSQLNAAGTRAFIHVSSVLEGCNRNTQFDLAPFLYDGDLGADATVVLAGAHQLKDSRLASLRALSGGRPRRSIAVGSFPDAQARIGTTAKLSYIFQRDPEIIDLSSISVDGLADARLPIFGVAGSLLPAPQARLLLVSPDLTDRDQVAAIEGLALSHRYDVSVLTNGKSKQEWIAWRGSNLPVFHYSEVLPVNLTDRVDVCLSFAGYRNNYRLQCLFANLAVSGTALIDCSDGHQIVRADTAFIRGPTGMAPMAAFLDSEILPNLRTIQTQSRVAAEAADLGPQRVLRTLSPDPKPVAEREHQHEARSRIVFMPTNGVGLGHAQRCVLIGTEMTRDRRDIAFAAFPSCTRLVQSYGFDAMPLISRSVQHAQSHENDLANYLRLRGLTRRSALMVFDGGYIFDSAYRTILDNRLRGVWIRRGLWQSHQDNSVALDREKAFDRVIVPRDAFDELNIDYSHGDHVRHVGPVVRRLDLSQKDRQALRDRIAARYEHPFERLVVSYLGGGVAADRGAQTQALCAMLERRSDVLHLVVNWPSATMDPVWFQWSNSRVVKTHHAGTLAAAADLCVSAAGYNSFHEALYNRAPTIFVPQTGSFMDDQTARARAAQERGLAALVEAHQMMSLDREVTRLLDSGASEDMRRELSATSLPETGAAEAARLIEELVDG